MRAWELFLKVYRELTNDANADKEAVLQVRQRLARFYPEYDVSKKDS